MSASSRQLESWERGPFADAAPVIDDLRRRCAGCPPVRVLSAAAADALPADAQAVVAAHIESCPACLSLRADLEGLEPVELDAADIRRILARVERAKEPAARSIWRRWTAWVPASLAAAAAILAFVVMSPDRGLRPAPAVTAPVPPVAAVSPSAPPPLPAVPSPGLQKPPVKLTMLALTWRNGNQAGGGFAEAVAPALNAFRADRYDEAARLLDGLAERFASSVEIPFYQGVSQLFLGRNQEAVATLRRAHQLADDTFEADAAWYLGIALARSGHGDEARARFVALCAGKSVYAAQACDAAK
jgi:hypothetical protein